MKYSSLGLLEKCIICHIHCRHDVKYGLFQDTDGGVVISNSVEGSPALPAEAGKKLVISPFITLELNQLVAEARRIYSRKRYLVQHIPRYGIWKILPVCLKRFPDAIDWLDRSIDQMESEIHQLESVYQKTTLHLTQKRKEKLDQKRLAQAQMYWNALEDEQERFTAALVMLYQKKNVLLIEKLRLIELMEERIGQTKTRRFLRIRYYYGKACDYSGQQRVKKSNKNKESKESEKREPSASVLPLRYFTDKELSTLCGGVFDGDYTGLLQQTQEMLEETKALLSKLPPIEGSRDVGNEEGQEGT